MNWEDLLEEVLEGRPATQQNLGTRSLAGRAPVPEREMDRLLARDRAERISKIQGRLAQRRAGRAARSTVRGLKTTGKLGLSLLGPVALGVAANEIGQFGGRRLGFLDQDSDVIEGSMMALADAYQEPMLQEMGRKSEDRMLNSIRHVTEVAEKRNEIYEIIGNRQQFLAQVASDPNAQIDIRTARDFMDRGLI